MNHNDHKIRVSDRSICLITYMQSLVHMEFVYRCLFLNSMVCGFAFWSIVFECRMSFRLLTMHSAGSIDNSRPLHA